MKKSTTKPPKVLIVEDDPDILNALNIVLGSAGFDVEVSLNGKKILQNLFVKPDLFILDNRLPDAGGIEICRYLKSKPNYRDIPVVVISASPRSKNKALQAGAALFIEKPFDVNEMIDAVSGILHMHH